MVEEQEYRRQREAEARPQGGYQDMISGRTVRCNACAGSGILGIGSGNSKTCPICQGMGEVPSMVNTDAYKTKDKRGISTRSTADQKLPPLPSNDSDDF